MRQHEEIRGRLDDFADGALAPAERDDVLDHLARCPECRDELEGLNGLRDAARALPRGIAPRRDLWPEIEARLRRPGLAATAGDAPRAVVAVDFRAPRRPAWRPRMALAAAAMVLVALSSGITAYLVGGRGAASAPQVAATTPAPENRATTALAAFRPTEVEYLDTVEALEGALAARRDRLSPQTVAVIEENLLIIDQAIREARAALEADPASADLPLLLSGMYRTKVELLQRAVNLPQT